jgi:hypothetical protein
MAKEAGFAFAVSADDGAASLQVISNDVTNLQYATPRAVADWTGVDKSAIERGLLLADFSATLNGIFNDAANMSHAVFKTVPTTSTIRTLTLAISGQSLSCECLATDYSSARGADGNLVWTVPFVLANGTAPSWS